MLSASWNARKKCIMRANATMFVSMNAWIARFWRDGRSTKTATKKRAIELTGVNMNRLVTAQLTSSSRATWPIIPKSGRTFPRTTG